MRLWGSQAQILNGVLGKQTFQGAAKSPAGTGSILGLFLRFSTSPAAGNEFILKHS